MAKNIYKINEPVKVVYQPLGGTTGITDLKMVITDEQGNISSPVTLVEGSGALYEASFTPDAKGRWWVQITSVSYPENAVKESYFIGDQEEVIGIILQDADGDQADITATGRLKVSTEPPTPPPDKTAVIKLEYGNVSTTDDLVYIIPNGETLQLQRFSAGAETANSGNVVELWYDPNGNGVGMTIIDTIFCDGTSDQHDLNQTYLGDGTKSIRLIRKRLSGGSTLIFGRWEGYY